MPLYEYKCIKCGHRVEKIEKVTARTTQKCPKCGGKAERMFAAPAIQFKGTGWYVTDYAGKNSASASGENSGDKSGEKSSEKSGDKSAAGSSDGSASKSEGKSSESKHSTQDKGSEKRKK